MSEEPQLPPIPDIGDVVMSKKMVNLELRVTTVLKCKSCQAKYERPFKEGDIVFENLKDEECKKCQSKSLVVEEIYAEWWNTKKDKKI